MSRTALVLVDLQLGILDLAQDWDVQGARETTVEQARRITAAARAAAAPVFHVGVRRTARRTDLDEIRTDAAVASGSAPRDAIELLDAADIAFVIPPERDEEVVYKTGVSALTGTSLDGLLRAFHVGTVVLSGVFTHMAVESSARVAFDLGYRVIVAANACGSPARAVHESSLATLRNVARVLSVDDCITELSVA